MASDSGIHPAEDGWHWVYDGEPILLLGGTDTDNLFQWAGAGLEEQLDRLVEVGGNYVRNTMSDRGASDSYAFAPVRDGVWDLERPNEVYWEKLETFLAETAERDVVVQLTLWDQHDFGGARWDDHPWNPYNNVNYGRYDSGLSGPDNVFTAVDRNPVVYPHLRRFVDRILDRSLEHDHVLYNVNNESWAGEAWERHWAEYIRERAREEDERVHVTSMNMWPGQSVATVLRNPETFSYVELSQVNQDSKGETGQDHWDAVQAWREEVAEELGPRPLNHVKIYGTDEENASAGSADEAIERFWRNLLGGCASARFHRPTGWGLGLGERAQAHISSARTVAEAVDFLALDPRNDLLADRRPNEAYCAASSGEYVVYFPDGGTVDLDVDGSRRYRWLDAEAAAWDREASVGDTATLSAPGGGHWVAVLTGE